MLLESGAMAAHWLHLAETSPEEPAPGGWHDSLARSKARIAGDHCVPLLTVLDRLRTSAERLEAEQGVTAEGAVVTTDR